MKFFAFRPRGLWSRRIHLIVVLACLIMIMVTGMTTLTDHITGYREKVQPLVALDLNEVQRNSYVFETIDYSGRPIDYSQESRWSDGYNNYSDMKPLKEESVSRPYSFLWRQQKLGTSLSTSPFCNARYAFDVVQKWRQNIQPFCEHQCSTDGDKTSNDEEQCATPSAFHSDDVGTIHSRNTSETSKFSLDCSMIHLDIPENLCNAKNLVLHVDDLPKEPRRGSLDMWLAPGATDAKCKLKPDFYNAPSWGFGGSRWLYTGLQDRLVNGQQLVENVTCDGWIESDLYLVSRYDTGNVYHIHQDLIQAFIGFAASDMNLETTEVVFLDSNVGGISSLNSLWTSLFSGRTRSEMGIRTIRDVVQDAQSKSEVPINNICFRSVTFGFHAGVTLFSREKAEATSCDESVVLKSYIDFVLYRLKLPLNFQHTDSPSNFTLRTFQLINPPDTPEPVVFYTDETDLTKKPLVVTFMSRNPTKHAWNTNTQRMIRNEHSVLLQLQAALENYFSTEYLGRALVFRRINPVDIPTMKEQIALARESDIIIGPHGASLIYTTFLPPYGGVIELQHPTRRFNYQFYNIAALTGPKLYRNIDIGDSIRNVRAVEATLLDTVGHVLRRMDNNKF